MKATDDESVRLRLLKPGTVSLPFLVASLFHPLVCFRDLGESHVSQLLFNSQSVLVIGLNPADSDTLDVQCSTDGELGSHPFQETVPGYFPVENSNPIPVHDDISWPEVVVSKDECGTIHSELFTMLPEDFYARVARFSEWVHPIHVDFSHLIRPKGLEFRADLGDASHHVLFFRLGHVPPRFIESLARYVGLEQVGLPGLFSVEENCGNSETKILFRHEGQGLVFSSGGIVGKPNLADECVAKAEHSGRIAGIVDPANMAAGRRRTSVRRRDGRCRKCIARTVATIPPQAGTVAGPFDAAEDVPASNEP